MATESEKKANRIVQALWIGPTLSQLEQLSIRSFLHQGHDYHLYVYDEPRNLPRGTVLHDAGEILPANRIFTYRDHDSPSAFANLFRYRLLLERGGWWVDTDVVCLRPFEFAAEHLFSTERLRDGTATTSSGVLKAPAASPVMEYALRRCEAADPKSLRWGETGPALLGEAVEACGFSAHRQRPEVFCPVNYWDWERVLDPQAAFDFDADTHAVHLWNEMWRRAASDKDRAPAAGSLYERLLTRFPERSLHDVAMRSSG
ncbi:MAG: glycosyltransferase [Thermoanaerobaculia bacterium]